jgi:hypothetical protein
MYQAISLVFHNHPELLEFFFEKDQPRIRFVAEDMRREAAGFSDGQQILIRVALDMWSGSGNAKIWQVLEGLDDANFSNCLRALGFLRGISSAN